MFGAEDTVGIAASIRALRLGAEHSVGSVDRYAFEVAFGSLRGYCPLLVPPSDVSGSGWA